MSGNLLAETVGGFRRLASIESHSREMEARAKHVKEVENG